MEITGKTVLITGASSGIGAATARSLADAGAAQVLLIARSVERLNAVAAEIEAKGVKTRVYAVDLSKAEAASGVAATILAEVGAPDLLVNCAGIGLWKFLEDATAQEIYDETATPYLAAAWLISAFLPAMRQRNSGFVVNVSSAGSRLVWPGATAYIGARWAMRGLTEALRCDLRGTQVKVTLYESGVVKTPAWDLAPGSRDNVPKIGAIIPELSCEQAAAIIVAGVRADSRLNVAPLMLKLIYMCNAVAPWAVRASMNLTGVRKGA